MNRVLAALGMITATVVPMRATATPRSELALPHNPIRAINVCMSASHPDTPNGKIALRDTIEALWYLLEGIREIPEPGSLADRLSAFPDPDAADNHVRPEDAPQLVNLCQQRWNNSHRGAIEIMLPVRRFGRAVQCYSVISFVDGMIGSDQVIGERDMRQRITQGMRYYQRVLTPRTLAAHGLASGHEQDAFFSRKTLEALDLGNFNDVLDACLKTPAQVARAANGPRQYR